MIIFDYIPIHPTSVYYFTLSVQSFSTRRGTGKIMDTYRKICSGYGINQCQ